MLAQSALCCFAESTFLRRRRCASFKSARATFAFCSWQFRTRAPLFDVHFAQLTNPRPLPAPTCCRHSLAWPTSDLSPVSRSSKQFANECNEPQQRVTVRASFAHLVANFLLRLVADRRRHRRRSLDQTHCQEKPSSCLTRAISLFCLSQAEVARQGKSSPKARLRRCCFVLVVVVLANLSASLARASDWRARLEVAKDRRRRRRRRAVKFVSVCAELAAINRADRQL